MDAPSRNMLGRAQWLILSAIAAAFSFQIVCHHGHFELEDQRHVHVASESVSTHIATADCHLADHDCLDLVEYRLWRVESTKSRPLAPVNPIAWWQVPFHVPALPRILLDAPWPLFQKALRHVSMVLLQ